jgi:hypothetical protein
MNDELGSLLFAGSIVSLVVIIMCCATIWSAPIKMALYYRTFQPPPGYVLLTNGNAYKWEGSYSHTVYDTKSDALCDAWDEYTSQQEHKRKYDGNWSEDNK